MFEVFDICSPLFYIVKITHLEAKEKVIISSNTCDYFTRLILRLAGTANGCAEFAFALGLTFILACGAIFVLLALTGTTVLTWASDFLAAGFTVKTEAFWAEAETLRTFRTVVTFWA